MVEDVYPLSPLQEGFYYHWLEAPGASAYFNQISCRVNGALEINKIEESYRILSARHAVLRTFFTSEYSDNTLQVVIKDCPPAFTYKEIPGEVESSVEEYKYTDRKKGFNLHNGSQIRLTLLGLGENAYEFIWSHHHILMDGWCIGILINEFFQIYHSLVRGATIKQETVRPYSDYIKWLMKKEKSGSLRYWKEYLSGFNTLTPLPKRPVKEEGIAHHPGETSVSLDPSVRAAMKRLCSTLGITDYIFIQTAWAVLLSRYNNTGDVVFGSVVSGRPGEIDGIERMVGLFINTIPVRVKINSGVTIRQLLKEVQQRSIEESEHHYTQLADIQSQSEIKQSLFDHILQFQNFPVEEMIQQSISDKGTAGELSFLSSDTFEQNNYDFTCMVIPSAALTLKFSYNSCMYEASQVKQMESHFLRVITQMALSPESAIGQIDYLSEEEKLELEGFNDTKVNYPTEKTIINLFEEQVKKYPENIAVTAGTTALTYRELNERSNQLASYLRKEYKIKPDDLIGIKVERSEVMIIAILGVLKSGGAYVPIDPEYPQERIEYMIADSCCKVVLDAGELKKFEERSGSYEKENPTPVNKPHDLAYVIYTSGTTGKPKGSLIEHKNVVRLFKTGKPLFDFNEKDVWTMFHSYCFDFSVWEMYGALLYGGKLVMVPSLTAKDPKAYTALLRSEGVTVLNQTPSSFYNVIKAEEEEEESAGLRLRYVIFGGEALSPGKLKSWKERYPQTQLINMYGITETTVHVTYKEITEKEITANISNIGVPIPTLSCYVLDQHQQLLPTGIPGELYVGGDGLARGYLNREDLTAERFINSPFKEGERLYRSGDKVKRLASGELEYLGRIDDQVKIRGYRIELGEIEHALQKYPAVESCVVLARTNQEGEKELVAYVVSSEPLNTSDLHAYIGSSLPSYMIPSHFVQLETMPLTGNGKVDKKALPDPEGLGMSSGKEYVGPRNAIEEKLVAIWSDVLGIEKEKISMKDNFFEIGGHSLKATKLILQISKKFDVRIPLNTLFVNPTIENIADEIEKTYYWIKGEVYESSDNERFSI